MEQSIGDLRLDQLVWGDLTPGLRSPADELPAAERPPGERAEKQIMNFIDCRYRQRRKSEPEQPSETPWTESERRYNAAREARMRREWHAFHLDQAERHRATLEALIARHEQAAEKYR